MLNKSDIIFPFILKSRGESVFKDGERFISSSHGFNSESIKISNPNRSKQLFLCSPSLFTPSLTTYSIDIIDFIIMSYI
jgi:hypothetical protein